MPYFFFFKEIESRRHSCNRIYFSLVFDKIKNFRYSVYIRNNDFEIFTILNNPSKIYAITFQLTKKEGFYVF